MPSFPALSEPLAGSTARLRLVAERDIPEILIAHEDDPQLCIRLGLRRPPSGAELGRRIEEDAADRAVGRAAWLTILAPDTDDCRGQIDVHEVDWDHGRAELGIWIAPGMRRRGLGADALALAGRWLVRSCGLERVALLTEPDNVALRRAAVAAGFSEEGRLRSYLCERGQRIDVTVMSLVAGDLVAR
ncbi:MAG: GNAT family protein [Solirubrobacteraceae bacterium]